MTDDAIPDISNPIDARMEARRSCAWPDRAALRSGDIARIASATGHDFMFIDAQHSIFSVETIGHIAQAALACGIAPLVRVRSCEDPDIPLLLDNGVTGIVFPDVNTADDARRGANSASSRRSAAVRHHWPSAFDYRPVPPARRSAAERQHAGRLHDRVAGRARQRRGDRRGRGCGRGAGRLTDLLADMGKPGAYGDPEAMAAVARITKAAMAHGKFAGVGGDNELARQRIFIRDGVRFISTQSDGALLMAAASRVTAGLRDASRGASSG